MNPSRLNWAPIEGDSAKEHRHWRAHHRPVKVSAQAGRRRMETFERNGRWDRCVVLVLVRVLLCNHDGRAAGALLLARHAPGFVYERWNARTAHDIARRQSQSDRQWLRTRMASNIDSDTYAFLGLGSFSLPLPAISMEAGRSFGGGGGGGGVVVLTAQLRGPSSSHGAGDFVD